MSRIFKLLDFYLKKIFLPGGVCRTGGANCPPSLTKQFDLYIYSKIWVQAVLA